MLEDHFGTLCVVGEVSDLRVSRFGHVYFTLKDEHACIPAVMFRSSAQRLPSIFPPNGSEVECLGRVTLYEVRGRTQLIVEWIRPKGVGFLDLKFQQLKARLAAEGLFDLTRKRPLPLIPECIGVVTSPTGAAIRDVLHILGRRFPFVRVLIYPARVQGAGAAEEIAEGIDVMGDGKHCDVLIVTRGGGSVEDLWAFNEEVVVRAIARSKVPVVSGVGHEVDIVLSDLAADVRMPTPSAAAERVVPDQEEVKSKFADQIHALQTNTLLAIVRAREQLTNITQRVRDPTPILANHSRYLDELTRNMIRVITHKQEIANQRLAEARVRLAAFHPRVKLRAEQGRFEYLYFRLTDATRICIQQHKLYLKARQDTLQGLSPFSVLYRGYSVVTDTDGRLVRSAKQVTIGDRLQLRMAEGKLGIQVEEVELDKDL